MSSYIHPQAIVSDSASIGENVTVGPYAIIGEHVKLASGCVVDSFAQVVGYTEVGENCRIFSHAVVGNIPQDLKYKGERSFLVIGKKNKIREFVTINPGTDKDTKTVIGDGNLIMAYAHIAHDCVLGNNNILANSATLAGYVEVGNRVVIGGLVAIHQFCRVGDFSIIGGCSKVVQDIPPYSMCDGHPAAIRGLNIIGLKRAKFDSEKIKVLKKAFKIIFFENHPFSEAKNIIQKDLPSFPEAENLTEFISSSKRGISR
ncbi:MAG: acyl-ACP--UDP-N-acetylglucosamine O-acyltransferase [Candidatus Omnitrophica bacterium]|nr:acyl-ACP--UDP-N-acetylglucosamine O-acyltransferase [Candidatus Omnitrophota bacterium]MBD3268958.1 acyl-ACP--UDP-N-acetylglucosamine O-acyltransferase [Candidatus Omnitrophota bacterium]